MRDTLRRNARAASVSAVRCSGDSGIVPSGASARHWLASTSNEYGSARISASLNDGNQPFSACAPARISSASSRQATAGCRSASTSSRSAIAPRRNVSVCVVTFHPKTLNRIHVYKTITILLCAPKAALRVGSLGGNSSGAVARLPESSPRTPKEHSNRFAALRTPAMPWGHATLTFFAGGLQSAPGASPS